MVMLSLLILIYSCLWFVCTNYKHSKRNTCFKDSRRTTVERPFWKKNDRLCDKEESRHSREDKREDRRRQRKTEREKRGERESDRQHFSLEETPRTEKLLSSNTGHIREHDDTHTMLSPHFFPSSVCNAKHLNHSPADLFTLPGVFLSRVQF